MRLGLCRAILYQREAAVRDGDEAVRLAGRLGIACYS